MPRSGASSHLRSASLGLLPLLLTLVGCSGTPLGDTLSRSFPGAPSPPPATPNATTTPGTRTLPATPNSGSPPRQAPTNGRLAGRLADGASTTPKIASGAPSVGSAGKDALAKDKAAASTPQSPSPLRAVAAKPTPYRVTLRLPQADPAAPAEGLTEALRAAGVPFEVETIERLPSGTATGGAAATAPPTPQVRPAPPVP
jgi:hypothetical protein